MKYVNKNTGDIIGVELYYQLSMEARNSFVAIQGESCQQGMSIGDGIATAVVLPVAIVASIFDDFF